MTAYSTDRARDAIAGLVGTGAAVPLTDPVRIAEVVDGARQAYADVCKERTPRGELARDVEAEADPHPKQDGVA